ncbi:MAG: outer membrane beta-barrel protein, partial [Bacteroidales bacterium]|nr:outer membrane beta-barrel protein [Bacteroidales bacterium]
SVSLFFVTKPRYGINCGLRADFLDRKISVHLNVNDIFNWNADKNENRNPYYQSFFKLQICQSHHQRRHHVPFRKDGVGEQSQSRRRHGDGIARGVENSHAITSPHPSAPNFHFGELFLNELHHADSTAVHHLYEVNS